MSNESHTIERIQSISIRTLMRPFAVAINAKRAALLELAELLTLRQRRRITESISGDIRKATDLHPHGVSIAAGEAASRLGVDLRSQSWHDQHRFDRGRITFLVEHMVTVSSIRDECLAAADELAILEILVTRPRVVWVLRDEDKRLTDACVRYRRPDPVKAYADARIELLEPPASTA